MQRGFEIWICHRGTESRLICRGEIDVCTAPKLEDAVNLVLEKDPTVVHVDWSEVSLLASAGVDALVRAKASCAQKGIELTVVASPPARRVLDILGCCDMANDDPPKASPESRHRLRRLPSRNRPSIN